MSHPQTRMTRQRMVILEELKKVRTHPTADELYAMVRARLPRISLGTVEAAGSIRRFDGDIRPHQHIRCTNCGRVGDVMSSVPVPDIAGLRVEGFTATRARVEFEGICDACSSADA